MWHWLAGIHWRTLLVGAMGGAMTLNAFMGAIAKAAGDAFLSWARNQRGRFLSEDQKKILWLTSVGEGRLVLDQKKPGNPVIWSPQRGYRFNIRGKIKPLLNWGLLEIEREDHPNQIIYRLTERGAERAEKLPDFENEFPLTGDFPDMKIY